MVDTVDLDSEFSQIPRHNSRRDRSRSPITSSRNRILIINIPYTVGWQDLKDIIKEKVENLRCFVSMYTINGRPSGAAIVEAHNKVDADRIILEMDQFTIEGRRIVARYEGENDRYSKMRGAVLERGGNGGNGGNGGGDRGVTEGNDRNAYKQNPYRNSHRPPHNNDVNTNYPRRDNDVPHFQSVQSGHIPNAIKDQGITIDMLNKLEISPEQVTHQIYVGNLQYDVDSDKIKEVFSMAGDIVNVDIKHNAEGKSRGFGTVTFKTELHAVQAISMFNGIGLNKRDMRVRMDRVHKMKESRVRLPDGLSGIGDGLGVKGLVAKNADEVRCDPRPMHRMDIGEANQSQARFEDYHRQGYPPHNRRRDLVDFPRERRVDYDLQYPGEYPARERFNEAEYPRDAFRDNYQREGYVDPNKEPFVDDYQRARDVDERYPRDRHINRKSLERHATRGGRPYDDVDERYSQRNRDRRIDSSKTPLPPGGHNLDAIIRELEVDQRSKGDINDLLLRGDMRRNINDRHNHRAANQFPPPRDFVHERDPVNYITEAQAFQTGDDSVIVTGLPHNLSWLDLRSKFREVGDVRYAEIAKTNRGRGVVRFTQVSDADKCVDQLNNTNFLGSNIRVCLEKDSR